MKIRRKVVEGRKRRVEGRCLFIRWEKKGRSPNRRSLRRYEVGSTPEKERGIKDKWEHVLTERIPNLMAPHFCVKDLR